MTSERVSFESQGVALGGRMAFPDSGIAAVGVLCITGGGRDDCDVPYLEWQEFMAEAGIASLAFNARGMGDSEGSFRTDDEGFHPFSAPANSQGSRTADTVVAYKKLMGDMGIADEQNIGLLGGSMGGDIALHAVSLSPGAVALRAPSAYPNEVHNVAYGKTWGPLIKELGDDTAALGSSNFQRIQRLGAPLLLIYSGGDTVIPKIIQDKYIASVQRAGGTVEIVGDETTPHSYINDRTRPGKDNEVSRRARERTYAVTTGFFAKNLA